MTRTLAALLVTLPLALGAAAQSSAEFGRASSGSIDTKPKGANPFSGSLTLTHGSGGQRYEGSASGVLVDDRAWFFATAAITPRQQFSSMALPALDAKATAPPVDWTKVTMSLGRSFLSLRATKP
ncbi:MAG TPA: hypothetical protein VF266_18610 [Thermoanaerobaculia bacterium]